MAIAREHLASRYTVISNLYRDHESVDMRTNNLGFKAHQLGEGAAPSCPSTNHMSDSFTERREEQLIEPGFSDMFFFDPFNMQSNGYYDPQLDFSLALS